MQTRCPICDKPVDSAAPTAPFCSPRCRQIDLGRWLDEQYTMPVERGDEDPDESPPDGAEEE
ncbi:MAG TPA: DNA gyrase inhibitor YacG [Pirellulales bacterium]|jgi:hypothetical protein|nr:DNA gyrase inhibitor YacG [Pirellulales bacterium]